MCRVMRDQIKSDALMISMRSADKITAIILIILGLSMLWGGFVMDRLEIRGIHPLSIPGLVPMGLGVLISICGGLLYISSGKADQSKKVDLGRPANLIWAVILCLIFATILVGNIPFFWAAFIFISAFATRFTWKPSQSSREKIKTVLFALGIGLVFSGLISVLFRYAFLIRLP